MQFNGPNPKPPPRTKRRSWLRKVGNKGFDWEAFKLQLVYPWLWIKTVMYLEQTNMAVKIQCACPHCVALQAVGQEPHSGWLRLRDKPDADGHMWEVENLHIHHDTKRSSEPSEIFVLANCKPYATECHERRHRR